MAVTRDDVKHVAALARLSIADERAEEFTSQLNTILVHMEVLARVDTSGLESRDMVDASTVLQQDRGPSVPLVRPIAEFAPETRDGFFIVPRLETHDAAGES